ncbi:MAG TPA: hypothetical protein VK765_05550 [Solirubrobacteraceae bacterium]|jgi:hypothetical protein|nr:hypothetical protein [Solirubrobacteraceae bacterium]
MWLIVTRAATLASTGGALAEGSVSVRTSFEPEIVLSGHATAPLATRPVEH